MHRRTAPVRLEFDMSSHSVLVASCFCAIAFGAPAAASGQDASPPAAAASTPANTADEPTPPQGGAAAQPGAKSPDAAKPSEKKGEWLFAPIPISSPAIGSGLEFAVARLFPFNKKDEISP